MKYFLCRYKDQDGNTHLLKWFKKPPDKHHFKLGIYDLSLMMCAEITTERPKSPNA